MITRKEGTMMKRSSLYAMFLLVLLACTGCEVPTKFKQDAIDISGKYLLTSQKDLFGPEAFGPEAGFEIENETAVYDVRMLFRRTVFPELESRLFDAVTVDSEKTYLRQRVLLGAGYREIDSGDLFESRENLSRDGGKTGTITLRSRFFKLKSSKVHMDFFTKGDDSQAYCCKTRVVSYKDDVGISISCTDDSRTLGDTCASQAEGGELFFQAFRYRFDGETSIDSNEIKGRLTLEVRSILRLSSEESINVTKPLWSSDITLEYDAPISR